MCPDVTLTLYSMTGYFQLGHYSGLLFICLLCINIDYHQSYRWRVIKGRQMLPRGLKFVDRRLSV